MVCVSLDLYRRLRKILLQCDVFESDDTLRAVFAYSHLSTWRDKLPELGGTPDTRVATLIRFLEERYDTITGENALVLFLLVLAFIAPSEDSLRAEITEFIRDLKEEQDSSGIFTVTTGNYIAAIYDPYNLTLSRYRLDTAIPEQVYLRRTFDVAASVRLPTSPLLEEDELPRVKSGDARLFWPAEYEFIRLRLQVNAPECQIVGNDHYTFLLPKDEDSLVFYFNLIPKLIGDITIIVTLYQEDDAMGSTRVRTTAVEHIAGEVRLEVTSQEVIVDFNEWATYKARVPHSLSAGLFNGLKSAFTTSHHLASDRELHTLFVDARLATWRDLIPDNTPNRSARVHGLIHSLYDKSNAKGDNALALFLQVLTDHTSQDDNLHKTLRNLATDLEKEL